MRLQIKKLRNNDDNKTQEQIMKRQHILWGQELHQDTSIDGPAITHRR